MSELRQDFISGDWVIIAPGRAARPKFLSASPQLRKSAPKSTCPFERPETNGNWPPIVAYPNSDPKRWQIIAIPNKYPAVEEHDGVCSMIVRDGMYVARTGIGKHDLIITRDHHKNFAELTPRMAIEIMVTFQKLCNLVVDDPCTVYAIPFLNWGNNAGASISHPHYQFLSLPIVPTHAVHSLRTEEAYYKKHRRCARCEMISFEKKEKRRGRNRIVAENSGAIAIMPYASKFPFETRILLKKHSPFFHTTSPRDIASVASLLQLVLRQMKKKLNDPDLNFFIHEAPLDSNRASHAGYHHWHLEVIPRVSTPAGFELSTGIYINTVAPENAAAILRGGK